MAYYCSICGEELIPVENLVTVCSFCGHESPARYLCPAGHYLCESCQLADWPDLVERVCEGTKEKDPFVIVNLIMKHPMSVMHSPQHHILVAPVVLAAMRNTGIREISPGRLHTAIERTKGIPLGSCGMRGECGAATSVGALVSILTGATFTKDHERSLALRATAETLLAIADAGGPRCCKQSVYLALETASGFLRRELNIQLLVNPRCEFSSRNKECKKERCKYYVE